MLSLNDPRVQAAFEAAAERTVKVVDVAGEPRPILTPYPSPQDWRDVWIHRLTLDRLDGGESRSPVSLLAGDSFQGGVFHGNRARLKSIKELGAAAIWLSLAIGNRQSNPSSFDDSRGRNFLQPEPRSAPAPETADDELRNLVDEAHAQGLYVIFDAVLNPPGGVFGYSGSGLNGFAIPAREGMVHLAPNALIHAHQYVIARYDVDGLHVAPLESVGRGFTRTFGNAIREYALSIGKKNFFTFGEVDEGEDRLARFIGRNTSDDRDMPGVDAALDVPLASLLPRVARGVAPPTSVIDVYRRRKAVERHLLSSHGEAGRCFVAYLDDQHRVQDGTTDAEDPQAVLAVALLFGLQGIPCLGHGAKIGEHGRGGLDSSLPLYRAIQSLSEVRDAEPALRYGRLYFRPISGDGVHFGASTFAPGVLAFSRILHNREILIVANTSTTARFTGHVLLDLSLHAEGDVLRILNAPFAPGSGVPPGPVRTRDGLTIQEVEGGLGTGPANTIEVDLAPIEVQILG
ncbi:alpha-amylase family glycosyl hydrolase [Paludisphaera rhizosphaerae]|uniref:hypothetical protein n=1 Tax=Paludisphaera rhizosphaerae TaxID=2711216 RepID=UPI0013EC3F76|nr:hypothetical protein [Paludisphaera rhizosphaerae]